MLLVASLAIALLTGLLLARDGHSDSHRLGPRERSDRSYVPAGPNFPGRVPVSEWKRGELEIVFFDVGQADAMGIRRPDGRFCVVDAGSNSRPIMDFMDTHGIREIEALVMTHPHHDHMGGALDLIESYPVKVVMDAGYPHTSAAYRRVLEAVESKDIDYEQPRAGDVLDWGPGLDVRVLSPDTIAVRNINNVSFVLSLRHDRTRVLLAADAEGGVEMKMTKAFPDRLPSDVLKVGHHGSRTSSSDAFLDAVRPRDAVISVATVSPYGHPHGEVLAALEARGIRIWSTAQAGSIVLNSDGDTYRLRATVP